MYLYRSPSERNSPPGISLREVHTYELAIRVDQVSILIHEYQQTWQSVSFGDGAMEDTAEKTPRTSRMETASWLELNGWRSSIQPSFPS